MPPTNFGMCAIAGSNSDTQLGFAGASQGIPTKLVSGGHEFIKIAIAQYHACGLKQNGSAYCWGAGAVLNSSVWVGRRLHAIRCNGSCVITNVHGHAA